LQEAVELSKEALGIFESLDDLRGAKIQRVFLAHALLEAGRPEEARTEVFDAIRTLGDAGLLLALHEAFLVAAAVLTRLDDLRAPRIVGYLVGVMPALAPLTVIPPFQRLLERTREELDRRLGAEEVRLRMRLGASFDQNFFVRELGGK